MPSGRSSAVIVALIVAGFGVRASFAGTINVDNASFENASGYWKASTAPSNWGGAHQVGSNGGAPAPVAQVYQTSDSQASQYYGGFAPAQGNNFLFLYSSAPSSNGMVWLPSNQLGTYAAEMVYTLTVALALPSRYASDPRDPGFALTSALKTISTYGDWADFDSQVASLLVPHANLPTASMTNYSITFSTAEHPEAVGKPIGIILQSTVDVGAHGNGGVFFDNVSLTTAPAVPIPEAASLGLIGLGGLALLRRRR